MPSADTDAAGCAARSTSGVVCRAAADVDDDPAVGECNDRRFPVEQYLAAEDVGVEAARALDVRADDEVREGDALAGLREVGHR
jgi:hypothetical protein